MLYNPEELAKMSHPAPEVVEWLKANPRPPPKDPPDVMEVRANMAAYEAISKAMLGPAPSDIVESELDVLMRNGSLSPVTLYKPASPPAGGSPLFVLFFGGGFVAGSRDQYIFRARTLVRLLGAVVACVTYRRGPEHKFPAAQHDSWDHLKWLSNNARSIGADVDAGFILGGTSAGATIAAALTRRSIVVEPLSNKITGQWLEIPGIFGNIDMVPEEFKPYWLSHDQCTDVPLMKTKDYLAMAEAVQWDPASPWYTPVAIPQSYKEMPSTYFAVDGADPLRDDGLIYEEMLKRDGVRTKLDLYPGCPHGHTAFMSGTAVSNKGLVDSFRGAAWLLKREVSTPEILAALAKSSKTKPKPTPGIL